MERIQTKTLSGRAPADVVARLNRAAKETDLTNSQLVARSVEHYIEENPERIETFYPDDSFAAFVEELCG